MKRGTALKNLRRRYALAKQRGVRMGRKPIARIDLEVGDGTDWEAVYGYNPYASTGKRHGGYANAE